MNESPDVHSWDGTSAGLLKHSGAEKSEVLQEEYEITEVGELVQRIPRLSREVEALTAVLGAHQEVLTAEQVRVLHDALAQLRVALDTAQEAVDEYMRRPVGDQEEHTVH